MKKIIDDILTEAQNEAQAILEKAKGTVAERLRVTQNECEKIENNERERCRVEISRLIKLSESARASRRRTRLLEIKQEIIEGETAAAYRAVSEIKGDEYERLLAGLLSSKLREGKCIIYLPKNKKPSKSLEKTIQELAKKKCCSYAISYDREAVRDGFVLAYGKIEENCTFDALFNEKRSEITDMAAQLLFGTEG